MLSVVRSLHQDMQADVRVGSSLSGSFEVGEGLMDEDVAPLLVEGGEIELVEDFTYLGSVLSSSGDVMIDVKNRITKACRVFGCLRTAVFNNPTLNTN